MAGRIRDSDVDEVRSRSDIVAIVGEQVALKPAGVGSLKGLCPFHDERSPSFTVRPGVGRYHCFGCGESGDVIAFLMAIDHLTFRDAVEALAARLNFTLTFEDGRPVEETANRVRLLEANRLAAAFFTGELPSAAAAPGQRFLAERGFDPQAAAHFGVGWAPKSWDALTKHLRGQGFSDAELSAAGLVSSGERGVYDRFRGRLVWPIRDLTGSVVGFGARRLLEDDQGPKYLNTPETPVYRKSQVLYGLDLAKRDVAREHRVVVVEGYTDVMACHLAGVTTALATCGTAFGVDHIKVLRRVLGDEAGAGGEVVFTFDPDAAGQKAAARAFAEEQRFSARTFVAVGADGLDPCDLRSQRGDGAVRAMLEAKRPMFEFMIRRALDAHDLETVEGRAAALRQAAPIVAGIRDPQVRPGYARELARWLGIDVGEVRRAMQTTRRPAEQTGSHPTSRPGTPAEPQQPAVRLRSLPDDPATRFEKEALMMIVQVPHLVGGDLIQRATAAGFHSRPLAEVRNAVKSQLHALGGAGWLERLTQSVPPPIATLVQDIAFAPLPAKEGDQLARTAKSSVAAVVRRHLDRRIAELQSTLQRAGGQDAERARELTRQLVAVQSEKRALQGL